MKRSGIHRRSQADSASTRSKLGWLLITGLSASSCLTSEPGPNGDRGNLYFLKKPAGQVPVGTSLEISVSNGEAGLSLCAWGGCGEGPGKERLELVEAACLDDLCTVEAVPTPARNRNGDPNYWLELKATGLRAGQGQLRVLARSAGSQEKSFEDTTTVEFVP